jgi:TetR/AcrR family transcriptional regulator, transcriptional repressor for nem operon
MGGEAPDRPKLTRKGERTRTRIIEAAARLIYERGVAGTTLDDVKAAAEVSGSQMYHYFPGKDELVQAVIAYQADVIAGSQRQADLGSAEGLRAWREMVIAQAGSEEGKRGCSLGSLAGQITETDQRAHALLADGFGQWQAAIGDGLRRLHHAGQLPDGTDPDALAITLLATLQGGLLLAQVQRDTRPLETAVGTLLELAGNFHARGTEGAADAGPHRVGSGRAAASGVALPAMRHRAVPAFALLLAVGIGVGGCASAAAGPASPGHAAPATSAAARTSAPVVGPVGPDPACVAALKAEQTLQTRQGKDQSNESALDQDFTNFANALSAAAQQEKRPATASAMTALSNDYTDLVASQSGAAQLPDMNTVQNDGTAFDKACA